MTPASSDSAQLALAVRRRVLHMVHRTRASHVGSCFSMADMLAVLYSDILRIDPANPRAPGRDRLIISKGHAAAAVYAVLAERGFFPAADLDRYCANGSPLTGHVSHLVPGVEASTGSLGHGLPIAAGLALAAQRDKADWRSFVISSDGECDEGSTWEAALFAGHHGLTKLVALVDYNKIQSFGTVKEVLDLEPFADKWRNFGWGVVELDGHDHDALRRALTRLPAEADRPTLLLCHTIKGKGVSFMENQLAWHYKSPSDEQLAQALAELGAAS